MYRVTEENVAMMWGVRRHWSATFDFVSWCNGAYQCYNFDKNLSKRNIMWSHLSLDLIDLFSPRLENLISWIDLISLEWFLTRSLHSSWRVRVIRLWRTSNLNLMLWLNCYTDRRDLICGFTNMSAENTCCILWLDHVTTTCLPHVSFRSYQYNLYS